MTRDHGWLDNATSPQPRPATKADPESLRHVACVDHATVVGLRQKVCIAHGRDRDEAIAEARELAGVTAW